MRLTLINPETTNINLIKEGAIPFFLYKHIGYNVTIVCHKSGDYPYAETIVKGIELKFIDRPNPQHEMNGRSIRNVLNGPVVQYLKKHAQEIDVLHLTGFSKETLIYSFMYKKFNRNGLVYVKADTDYGIIHIDYLRSIVKRILLKPFFNYVDFYSVESSPVLRELQEKYPNTLKGLIPRAIPFLLFESFSSDREIRKENIILTVARLGAYQKNSELLVRAFMRLKKQDWSLVLIGAYDQDFHGWIKKIFENNPDMRARIQLLGNLTDRETLFEWYKKSAIFCLPSRHESFGIALLEASACGCYPVTTGVKEIPAAVDITDNWKYGRRFTSEDEEGLLQALEEATNPVFEKERERISKDLRLHIMINFNGYEIVEFLNDLFTQKINKKMGVKV